MFSFLPSAIQDELQELAQRYGQPLIKEAELQTSQRFDPLGKTDRYGEVCMVIRRKNGRLLTMIKSHYPAGCYRLLTGGINHGEFVFDALLRETQEETGLQVAVKRFLTAITYYQPGPAQGEKRVPIFYTFAFLLDELDGVLAPEDEEEDVQDFREVTPDELLSLADYLAALGDQYSPELRGEWDDWGRFRAIVHRAVWEALQA
jgi:8-oxo-dGTP pyrophosphatase MutT (NUDIX family)